MYHPTIEMWEKYYKMYHLPTILDFKEDSKGVLEECLMFKGKLPGIPEDRRETPREYVLDGHITYTKHGVKHYSKPEVLANVEGNKKRYSSLCATRLAYIAPSKDNNKLKEFGYPEHNTWVKY